MGQKEGEGEVLEGFFTVRVVLIPPLWKEETRVDETPCSSVVGKH